MSDASPNQTTKVSIQAIGKVRSGFKSLNQGFDYASSSIILIDPALEPALLGIEYFSHLWVIYHQDKSAEWLKTHGMDADQALVLPSHDARAGQGVFSSRAPCRPARLGSCIVRLLGRKHCTLEVEGLDALDGTQVLDVKPYVPQFDAVPHATIPLYWARVMDLPQHADQLSRELHWDTTHLDFALGQRAGLAVLRALDVERGNTLSAHCEGSPMLALGFEMSTGCSPLRGSLTVQPVPPGSPVRRLWIRNGLKELRLFMYKQLPNNLKELADTPDSKLWEERLAPFKTAEELGAVSASLSNL